MARLTVRLFGTFSLAVDGRAVAAPSTAKARAMLAYLLAHGERGIARERLAEAFWPDSDGDRARSSVGTALWAIRRALRSAALDPDDYVAADTVTVTWRGAAECDVMRFERALRDDPARAIELYGGPFLEGIYDEWTVRERERLEALYESALERSLGGGEAPGDAGAAVERNARAIVARNPYSEDAWTALIEHDLRQGALASARASLARALAGFSEAGLSPSAAFGARFRALAEGEAPPDRLPFVGRERELERVLGALRDPSAPGGVVVIGQAGIGKTELLRHVAALLGAAGARPVWIVPHHQRFGLDGLEELAARTAGRTVAELRADASDTRARVVAAALVADPAVTYLVDDLHWADGDAREILVALASVPGRAVVATRPEGRALLHAPGALADIVELAALDRASVVEALRRMRLGAAEREQAYAVSGGYPLALDALLRASAGREAFAHVPDVARLLLERRLDERGPMPARAASVLALEPSLDAGGAALVLDAPVERVLDAFDDLYALGILVDQPDGPAFCHDLFAEVAQRRIAPVRRRALHARIAETIGSHADPARYAHHLAQARRPLEAAQAYLRAAETRFTRGAFHDARELLRAGLDALGGFGGDAATEVRIALRTELARALADAGREDDAVATIRHAAAEARAARRDDLLLRALLVRNRLGIEMASVRGSECDEGELDEAVALAERMPAALASVQALGLAARGLMNRRLDAADRYAASALAIARRLDDPHALAEALQASATIAILRWNVERAIRETGELVAVARRIGTVRASRATGLHGVTHLLAQRYDDAEAFGRKALQLAAEPLPDDDLLRVSRARLEMLALELLTYVELQRGTVAGAVGWAERRHALAGESFGDRCEAAAILSVVLLSEPGAPPAAADAVAALLAPFADGAASIQRVYMLRVAQAMLAVVRGDRDAVDRVAAAWETCREVPAEETITLDYWLAPLARVARRAGCRRIAQEALARVREIVQRRRAGSGTLWLPAARSETRLGARAS
jgi:DNA-binding SARP family transcriptional activator